MRWFLYDLSLVLLVSCSIPAAPPESGPPESGPAARTPQAEKFRYGMQIEPGNDLDRAMTMLTAAGFEWAKVQVRWETIEREPGNVNWLLVEQVVAASEK